MLQPKQEVAALLAQNRDWSCHWSPEPGPAEPHSSKPAPALQHQDSQISSGLENLFLSSSIIKEQPAPLAQGAGQNALNLGIFRAFVFIFIALQKPQLPEGSAADVCCQLGLT